MAEKWLGNIMATLDWVGYSSAQEALDDGLAKVEPSYMSLSKVSEMQSLIALGSGATYRNTPEEVKRMSDNFIVEAMVGLKWLTHGLQVYDFDEDFVRSIAKQDWVNVLPDVIEYVPHQAFYLKLPFNDKSEGTAVLIVNKSLLNMESFGGLMVTEYIKTDTGKVSLVGHEEMSEGKWAFALVESSSGSEWWVMRYAIPSSIDYMYDETPLGEYPIELLLNALAYICTVNADINKSYTPPIKLKANRKKDKKRSQANWYQVGYYIGSRLREYERVSYEDSQHSGGSVRPHIRRAHFHHYWVGPKTDRRLELRWVEATEVGFVDKAELRPTLHRVG